VVAPDYADGQKETHDDYDCGQSVYTYAPISFSVGGVQWDPPLPGSLTNSFTSTAYVNVTSSDPDLCESPGRVNIGSCTWCVSTKSTNCAASGYFTLTNAIVSPTNGVLGSAFTGSATSIASNATTIITTHCPCSTNADTYQTNHPAPTIVSNWWTATVGTFSTNGTGLSASFTPTNCGSGTVTFYETYKNATPCDTNVYSATPVSASFNVLSLNIVDGGGHPISAANSNNVVIIGQNVALTAQTCGGTFSNFQWTVPGYAVSNYDVATGVLTTNFPTTNATVSFYWVDNGSKQVSCSAVCAGVSVSSNVTFTVVKPTATLSPVTSGTSISGGRLKFASGTNNGITFYNTLSVPAPFTGTAVFSQTISVKTITMTESGGTVHNWTNTCSPLFVDLPTPYQAALSGTTNFTPVDSPNVPLSAGYKSVSRTTNFKMTMLFQPTGGIAVPLLSVDWYWKASAATNGAGVWTITSATNSVNPSASATTTFPQWNCASQSGGFN